MFNFKFTGARRVYEKWTDTSGQYNSIRSSSDEQSNPSVHETSSHSYHGQGASKSLACSVFAFLPWVLSILFGCASIFLYLQSKGYRSRAVGSFEEGFSTEFGPAKSSISVHQVQFTGTTDLDHHGYVYIPNPSPVNYTGAGPEVDRAWEELVWGAYFTISEEEAKDAFHDGYQDIYNEQVHGYEIGIDMFHTLHCVNVLRKLIYPEIYPPTTHPVARIHNGHCVEQIRQYIMCAGDLSPIPVKFHPSVVWGNKSYAYSDVSHTCRDFDQIQTWLRGRFSTMSQAMQDVISHQ